MVEHYSTWFVDQVIESGECDFAAVIGVPSIVTVDWLGLDVEDWRRYASAHHAALAAIARQRASTSTRSRSTSPTWTSRCARSSRAAGEPAATTSSATCVQQEVDDRAGHRRRGVLDGRPAARRRRRHDRVAGQPDAGVALPAPGRAPAAHRRPVAAGPGDRGVPALLLPDPGAGPHGRQGHRVPRLPDEDGRPRAARVGVGQPRRRAVRRPRRARHRRGGRTGTRRSVSASTGAPARTSAGPWPRGCSARCSSGCRTTSSTSTRLEPYPHQGTNTG